MICQLYNNVDGTRIEDHQADLGVLLHLKKKKMMIITSIYLYDKDIFYKLINL